VLQQPWWHGFWSTYPGWGGTAAAIRDGEIGLSQLLLNKGVPLHPLHGVVALRSWLCSTALADQLLELDAVGWDVAQFGFEPLQPPIDPEIIDEDGLSDISGEPLCKLGEIWKLGEHRLICADSTKAETYEKLMLNEKAEMMFTDPPWNVAIGKDSNPRHRQREGLQNDDLSPEEFSKFLRDFATQAIKHIEGDVYCVLGASEWPNLDLNLREVGFHWSATIIWVKDMFVLGRSKYHRRYEPIWYGWNKKGKSSFQGSRTLDDVWEIKRPKRSEEHPTMKPVELMQKAIENSSSYGGIILEPFAGSGSTLLAAQTLGRKCYAIELEPLYCDVIIKRWQNLTGQEAERVEL
jgi:DNA modification methylase